MNSRSNNYHRKRKLPKIAISSDVRLKHNRYKHLEVTVEKHLHSVNNGHVGNSATNWIDSYISSYCMNKSIAADDEWCK